MSENRETNIYKSLNETGNHSTTVQVASRRLQEVAGADPNQF